MGRQHEDEQHANERAELTQAIGMPVVSIQIDRSSLRIMTQEDIDRSANMDTKNA